MKQVRAILLSAVVACGLVSPLLWGQEIHVTLENGVTTLSMKAQKSYGVIVSGEKKTPVLSIMCQQKGKKIGHAISFSPGGFLSDQEYSEFGSSASLVLEMTIGEHKQSGTWVAHGNTQKFDYMGKTEPERVQLLQALLNAPSISLEFTPFLTGTPISSTFDLTGLAAEFEKHPECSVR